MKLMLLALCLLSLLSTFQSKMLELKDLKEDGGQGITDK